MSEAHLTLSDFNNRLLLECSWEVCNKIGGIYTVLSTKAVELKKRFGDNLIFIGPDLGQNSNDEGTPLFKERPTILNRFARKNLPDGIKVRTGRWNIPGSPLVVLVDFKPIFPRLNEIYGRMWQHFRVDSLHAYGDYDESCALAVASAIVASELIHHLKADPSASFAHFNEWTTGMGLLYLELIRPEVATIFTTHATTVGRSICGNGKPLYKYFHNYNGDQMAEELNVQSKHSVEKAAAWNADCFTTVSNVTAEECEQLLGKRPDVVTPNGFEPSFVPDSMKWDRLRDKGRAKLLHVAQLLWDRSLNNNSFLIATSGRNEFRNKGIDLFLDSIMELSKKLTASDRKVVALILVPAWVRQPSGDLLIDMEFQGWIKPEPDYLTHRLNNEDSDAIACKIRQLQDEMRALGTSGKAKFIFVPSYLDCSDGIINISYYDLLPAIDLTVFGSYYEPWGYTPLESIAFGVPTITTDKAGFGEWSRELGDCSLEKTGVAVLNRNDDNYEANADEISNLILGFMRSSKETKSRARLNAFDTAAKAEWKEFIKYYEEAFRIAAANAAQRSKIINSISI